MILPELPAFSISPRVRCPACRAPIANWVVRERFNCPSCKVQLASRKHRASLIATAVVVLVYGAAAASLNWFSDIAMVGALIAILALPFIWGAVYRCFVRVETAAPGSR